MRKAQKYGQTSTFIRRKQESPYNKGVFLDSKTDVREDWGTACFAHLPGILNEARLMDDAVYKGSTITEIIFLPSLEEEFQTIEGIATILEFIEGVFKFMGVDDNPSTVLHEGWNFDLERSGQWNVAVGTLLRHTREYTSIPWTYCKLRSMRYSITKALFMAHFVAYNTRSDCWSKFNAPGGHTILYGKAATFEQYSQFRTWRKRDTEKSILESAAYRGICKMFGQSELYKEAAYGIAKSIPEPVEESQIRAFSRKLISKRGRKHEIFNRKPKSICRGFEP